MVSRKAHMAYPSQTPDAKRALHETNAASVPALQVLLVELIVEGMKTHRITQTELARRSGVNTNTLSNLMLGKSRGNLDTWDRLINAVRPVKEVSSGTREMAGRNRSTAKGSVRKGLGSTSGKRKS